LICGCAAKHFLETASIAVFLVEVGGYVKNCGDQAVLILSTLLYNK
jgi:hypothetical protein